MPQQSRFFWENQDFDLLPRETQTKYRTRKCIELEKLSKHISKTEVLVCYRFVCLCVFYCLSKCDKHISVDTTIIVFVYKSILSVAEYDKTQTIALNLNLNLFKGVTDTDFLLFTNSNSKSKSGQLILIDPYNDTWLRRGLQIWQHRNIQVPIPRFKKSLY